MLKLGKSQKCRILREKDFGVFVGNEGEEGVLLPIRQVPKGKKVGDEITVFVYKDSRDRLIATTRKPYMEVGEIAKLRVNDVNAIGAFMDIGLEKDILLPHREMRYALKKDMEVEVYLYIDKTERLAASMYTKKKEDARHISQEEVNTSRYEKCAEQIEHILEEKFAGHIPYTDKTVDPEQVKKDFGVSKAAFKKAIGKLLKEKKIKITKTAIFKLYHEEEE